MQPGPRRPVSTLTRTVYTTFSWPYSRFRSTAKHSEQIGLSLVVDMSNYVETAGVFYTHDLCDGNKDDRACDASMMLMKSPEFRTRFAVDQLGYISLKNRDDPLWRTADENSKERTMGRGLMAALRAASTRRCRHLRSRRIGSSEDAHSM